MATAAQRPAAEEWHRTACILCSLNCGIEVKVEGRRLASIRGDRANPRSHGYACEKAQRLDHYQNARDRLTAPLRRRSDGTYEEIGWDAAIAEVSERLGAIRDEHGGESIFYYGGGGQANHLGGSYAAATRAAFGVRYMSNALAQEKTGEFWVDGQLFGRPRCHTTPDFERSEVAMFVGKNPWQSHGFPRSRVVLKEIAKDPDRSLIVIDPRRTQTAEMADHHLQVRPGTDAYCLAALLAVLVEEDLIDHDFLAAHARDREPLFEQLERVPVADYCRRSGVQEDLLRTVARRIGRAESVAILEDLGIQQAPHSTLSSYLEKLLFLLTGNFARPGTMNIHTGIAKLGGDHPRITSTPVTGERIITGLVPGNAIAGEILTDDPARLRAMIVESSNPVHSLADSQRMRAALEELDLVVVLDVAMTETARCADYVLPSPTQFEKWEASFFCLEFPANAFQLRRPVLGPPPGHDLLTEPEIHSRLVAASGALDGIDVEALRAAASRDRGEFAAALFGLVAERPELRPLLGVVAYQTLGPSLPDGAAAAAQLWLQAHGVAQIAPDSVRRAGFEGEGLALGEALFDAILERESGLVFTVDGYEETWSRMAYPDRRINLSIPELLSELACLGEEPEGGDTAFPFVLSAGERRSHTANTIYRDPAWRKGDPDGALRIHPEDAERLGIPDGGRARLTTKRASVETAVEVSDTLQPGYVSLPNGFGLSYPADDGTAPARGVAPNELTASEDRDWFAGTPHHKHVRARVEPVAS
jgi:anaerobic selenocysteine-containing dehydrogenase